MTWFEKTKLRFQFFFLIMTVLGPVCLITTWVDGGMRRQVESYRWPSVDGKVVAHVAKPSRDEKGREWYTGCVVFNDSVGGRSYSSDLRDLGPVLKREDSASALEDVRDDSPCARVSVYYDPADPGIGVLENGIPYIFRMLIAVLCVLTAVGAVVSAFTIRGLVRWLRRRKAPAASGGPEL